MAASSIAGSRKDLGIPTQRRNVLTPLGVTSSRLRLNTFDGMMAARDLIWIRNLLVDLGVPITWPVRPDYLFSQLDGFQAVSHRQILSTAVSTDKSTCPLIS